MDALADALGPRALRNHPLGSLTTYGVGGPAALLVEVEGPDDLAVLRSALAGRELPVCVWVEARTCLVADAGFDGVVVRLGNGFNWVTLPSPDPAGTPALRGARRCRHAASRGGAPGGRRRVGRAHVGRGGAGLGRGSGAHERRGPRVGHGGLSAPLPWVDLEGGEGGTDDAARLCFGYRRRPSGPGRRWWRPSSRSPPAIERWNRPNWRPSSVGGGSINRVGPMPVRSSRIRRTPRRED